MMKLDNFRSFTTALGVLSFTFHRAGLLKLKYERNFIIFSSRQHCSLLSGSGQIQKKREKSIFNDFKVKVNGNGGIFLFFTFFLTSFSSLSFQSHWEVLESSENSQNANEVKKCEVACQAGDKNVISEIYCVSWNLYFCAIKKTPKHPWYLSSCEQKKMNEEEGKHPRHTTLLMFERM